MIFWKQPNNNNNTNNNNKYNNNNNNDDNNNYLYSTYPVCSKHFTKIGEIGTGMTTSTISL